MEKEKLEKLEIQDLSFEVIDELEMIEIRGGRSISFFGAGKGCNVDNCDCPITHNCEG